VEKRYVTFIVLSLVLVVSHQLIMSTFFPPKEVVKVEGEAGPEGENPDGDKPEGDKPEGDKPEGDKPEGDKPEGVKPEGVKPEGVKPDAKTDGDQPGDVKPDEPTGTKDDGNGDPKKDSPEIGTETPRQTVPTQWSVLGNYQSGLHLAYLTNKGAAIRHVELVERKANGRLRYRDLVNKSGYLGYLGLEAKMLGGCRVQVVGPGTPADTAGIKPGETLLKVNGVAIDHPSDIDSALSGTKPNDEANLVIVGEKDGAEREVSVVLAERPLAIIQEEYDMTGVNLAHRASFLMSLDSIRGEGQSNISTKLGETEIQDLRSMREGNWELKESGAQSVAFTWKYTASDLEKIGVDGAIEIVKTFRLPTPTEDASPDDYELDFNLALKNTGGKPLQVAYRLDGPNGLPKEGWWYLYKVHPGWGTCGARDVVWRTGVNYELRSVNQIWKRENGNKKAPEEPAFLSNEASDRRTVQFVGVDTQYFNVAILPKGDSENGLGVQTFQELTPYLINPANELAKKKVRLGNVSFRLVSEVEPLPSDGVIAHDYAILAAPKRTSILARYGMGETIVWGWFWWVAWPLSKLLHFFYALVANYGLAILFMTVMVRACVHPISRKAHKNTQMMQALSPEIKKLTERYKDDPQKKMAAQQELYKKHNFNPLSGCLLAFCQFPIFIGLYRCLSVDVELRDAALIPGVSWCTNLAGPDMLYDWGPNAFPYLTDYTGWLGPNLNVLPLISVVLFIVQQKMLTPPAADEQQQMQQNMMKFMTLFIGIMFYKVASGLCLYIIISSLWGVLERKLMPSKSLEQVESEAAKPAAQGKERPKRSAEDIKKAENAARRKKRKGKKGR